MSIHGCTTYIYSHKFVNNTYHSFANVCLFFMCFSSTVCAYYCIRVQDHYAHVLFAVLLISGDIAKRKPSLPETSSGFHRAACPNLRHSVPAYHACAGNDSQRLGSYRKIRLIEGNAKCRHLKSDLERDFAAALYLPEPPPVTHCTLYSVHTYVYLFTQGRGGG
jgi:hypothetical protein